MYGETGHPFTFHIVEAKCSLLGKQPRHCCICNHLMLTSKLNARQEVTAVRLQSAYLMLRVEMVDLTLHPAGAEVETFA